MDMSTENLYIILNNIESKIGLPQGATFYSVCRGNGTKPQIFNIAPTPFKTNSRHDFTSFDETISSTIVCVVWKTMFYKYWEESLHEF